jgi:hypothetical protein
MWYIELFYKNQDKLIPVYFLQILQIGIKKTKILTQSV